MFWLVLLAGCRPSADRDGRFGNILRARLDSSEDISFAGPDSAAGDALGYAISRAGDVNGDGYDDIVAGAYLNDDGGASSGSAYIFYGSASGLDSSGERFLASDDASYDFFGFSVSGAGDVDGDGYDDVIVGAYGDDDNGSYSGSAYVFFGSSGGISGQDKLIASDGANNDYFGAAVAGAGDLDGDGYDDVIVGAYGEDDGGSGAGAAYVYYGGSGGISSSTEDKLVASDSRTYATFGAAVSGAGDVNGDGYGDVIVGAYGDSAGGYNAGAAYIYYGSSGGIRSASEDKLTSSSGSSSDRVGTSVSAGDIDGDGYSDVVIGATGANTSRGEALVYYGSSRGIDTRSEEVVAASDGGASDYFGISVSAGGDIDGDGYGDLLVGAYLYDTGRSDVGAGYVYYGSATGLTDEGILTASGGGTSDQLGRAVALGGDFDGDGFDDAALGAPGADESGSNSGAVYVFGGSGVDEDGDGYPAEEDCDDTDASVNPGATEVCDGVDNDCDGTVDEDDAADATRYFADDDGDSYGDSSDTVDSCSAPSGYVSRSGDCDDTDASISPAGTEVCNDLDDDCDGSIDEGATDLATYYRDVDGDGYGESTRTTVSCSTPSGYAADSGDCNDRNASINPDAAEVCDGVDNDCDGVTDTDAVDRDTYYADDDGDGYGDASDTSESCSRPGGYVSDDTDCDDTRSAINPGATEVCDGVDNDCDGVTDTDAADRSTWYDDDDGDGYGDSGATSAACSQPAGSVSTAGDCDDTNASVNPGATEVCNSIDDDCDGITDTDATDRDTFYADDDGDSFGDASDTTVSCAAPSGYVSDDDDCDDTDAAVNPDAAEVCDGIDNNCDGVTDTDATDRDTFYADEDGDGYGDADNTTESCAAPSGYLADDTDCDDDDAASNPGATEVAYDGVDQDCDGADLTDVDGDGYDASAVGGSDCDDTDASTGPGASEAADGVDNDCDGTIDEGTVNYDDDGDGFTENGGDCNDSNPSINPAAPELPNSLDDDCDGIIDEGTVNYDDDGDGYSENDGDCDDSNASVSPGGTEVDGNGIDDDCDGTVDTGRYDPDGDGYLEEAGDCDDNDASIYPGADEEPDGVDNDCDGLIDEGTVNYDDDADGFSEVDGDCDDGDEMVNPDAEEIVGNGIDDDCDGLVDEDGDQTDDDGDGWTEWEGDCDDTDENTHPGAEEPEDGVDNDCDGIIDEGSSAVDDDADGFTEDDGDCDDSDPWIYPGGYEFCDELDNNCDGNVDESCGDEQGLTGEPVDSKSGCSTAGGGASGLWVLGASALFLRRRRRRRRSLLPLLAVSTVGCSSIESGVRLYSRILTVDESLRDVGAVQVGEPLQVEIELLSAGTGEVTLSTVRIGADPEEAFELLSWPSEIPAGETGFIEMTVQPDQVGAYRAELVIVSDAAEEELYTYFRAQAVEAAAQRWPSRIDFGVVAPGDEHAELLTIRNTGVLDLTLDEAAMTGSGAFSIEGSIDVIRPNEERQLSVVFAPSDAAAASGAVSLQLGALSLPDVELLGNDCEAGSPEEYDLDGDGATACSGDCDDTDASIRPGAPEVADGADQDCDGIIDEGTSAYDDDGDGYSENEGDCNDDDAAVSPDAEEVSNNGIDDDCDGVVDLGSDDPDGDGYTVDGGDCDEGDASVRPGAPEVADGVDNDCDGIIDEGTSAYDDDGDGVSEDYGDCDDADASTYTGAPELEDWIDNDCDGTIDEGTDHYDDDGDGFTEDGGDCDDTDASISPAELEVTGDGVDNDCDGTSS